MIIYPFPFLLLSLSLPLLLFKSINEHIFSKLRSCWNQAEPTSPPLCPVRITNTTTQTFGKRLTPDITTPRSTNGAALTLDASGLARDKIRNIVFQAAELRVLETGAPQCIAGPRPKKHGRAASCAKSPDSARGLRSDGLSMFSYQDY